MAVDKIQTKQAQIKLEIQSSVFKRYILIVLITLCASLQIALSFRMDSGYFRENEHIIKDSLAVLDDPEDDDTDTRFEIEDMS